MVQTGRCLSSQPTIRSLLTIMLRQGADLWLAFSKSPEDKGKIPEAAPVPPSPFVPCTRDIWVTDTSAQPLKHLGPFLFPRKLEGNARAFCTCSLCSLSSVNVSLWVHLHWFYAYNTVSPLPCNL